MCAGLLFTAVERAIFELVVDFQRHPERFWNERDMHWSLFYYLKKEQTSNEVYPTQLIRAEFPTLEKFGSTKPARGHYDLVILNEKSYNSPEIQNMESNAPWQEYLELLKIDIAIEIKLWLYRMNPKHMAERIGWDIQKLTDTPNKIQNAYFLNFVQLDFRRDHNKTYYKQLREYLVKQKKNWPNLNILCVPSNSKLQNNTDNWL